MGKEQAKQNLIHGTIFIKIPNLLKKTLVAIEKRLNLTKFLVFRWT